MAQLGLNPPIDFQAIISPVAAPRRGFNMGCIITALTPTTPWNEGERVRIYQNVTGVSEEFGTGTSVVNAAQLYFSQTPTPTYLAVGLHLADESALEALTACRQYNDQFYAVTFDVVPNVTDIQNIAAYVEAESVETAYFQTLQDPAIVANPETGILQTLRSSNFRRTQIMWSDKSPFAVMGIMGYAMGRFDGTANSTYTLKFKIIAGLETSDLTANQVARLTAMMCNVYILQGSNYAWYSNGKQMDRSSFDELINLDNFVNDCRLTVADLLYQTPKIPQTEGGVNMILEALTEPCEDLVRTGFVAPGVWKGQQVLNLTYGMALDKGYILMAEAIDTQTQADREARICPPIYICLKTAGAIEFVVGRIYVNR